MSSYTSFTPAIPSRLSAGQTAVYSSGHQQARGLGGFVPSQPDDQSAATSPLDIPAPSPRPFHGPQGQSSYHESRPFEGSVYDPSSVSGDIGVLSHSKIVELRLASEEDLPGKTTTTHDKGNAHRKPERGVPRGGPRGLTSSSSSSLRGRVHRGSGRGAAYTPPGGSQTYQEDSDRRTPSYPKASEEEDLLFTMSDMNARRSMEHDRVGDHHDAVQGGGNAPPGNLQRFNKGSPGGGSSSSGSTGKMNRW